MSVTSITNRKLGYASNITLLIKIERPTLNRKMMPVTLKTTWKSVRC
jgi:hypothetical protein